ncbi:hypothetical protein ES708_13174 [subsurface metagenome]
MNNQLAKDYNAVVIENLVASIELQYQDEDDEDLEEDEEE